jgi:4-fold beta-flower domain-containing protein
MPASTLPFALTRGRGVMDHVLYVARPAHNRSLMDAIYDQHGQVVAWRRDEDVYDGTGRPRAFMVGDVVYGYEHGQVLGWFVSGNYHDRGGSVVAFEAGASGGPAKPGLGGRPGIPGLSGRPGRPGRSGVPGRPGFSSSWSEQSWDRWLRDSDD